MNSNDLEIVSDAFTLCTLPDDSKVLFQFNQCLLDTDPLQTETLLQPHQARAHGVMVDDCAKRHSSITGQPGTQCIKIGPDTFDMYFDGWKTYFRVQKPTPSDLTRYPIFEITSSRLYSPQRRCHTRRSKTTKQDIDIDIWRARLGYPTFEVTEATIANTTQMVQTLQSETREYMRDHYKTRVWALRPKRINDTLYSDTFFSSIPSIRGFKCFQLFAYKASAYVVIHLMRRKSQAPETYEDVIRHHGAPNRTVTDNAKELIGHKWTSINRKYCIESGFTVPHHQHQNYAEGQGGNFKLRLIKLFHHTPHAPIAYWCYAASFLDTIGRFLSTASLNGRSSHETVHGDTADISIFRFPWFSPVWYYSPGLSFPSDKMEPGFMLDIAENTGDAFSYVLLPVRSYVDIPTLRNPTTLVRSVVRTRDIAITDAIPPRCVQTVTGFAFYNEAGEVLLGEDTLENHHSYLFEEDDDETMDNVATDNFAMFPERNHGPSLSQLDLEVFPIVEETIDEVMEEVDLPVQPSVSFALNSEIMTPRAAPTADIIPTTTPPVNKQHQSPPHLVEDVDSDDEEPDPIDIRNEEADYDEIASNVNNFFDDSDDYLSAELKSITDHRYLNGILEFEVQYTDGETEWHPIDLVQDDDAYAVATYVLTHDLGPISNSKHRRWARSFLRSLRHTIRRMRRSNYMDGFRAETYHPTPKKARSRRSVKARRAAERSEEKKNEPKLNRTFKYGFELPKTWKDILRIDKAAGNTLWQDAVKKEVGALIQHQCFDFRSPDYKPSKDYQYCRLHFVYEIKTDLRHKARLVCDGSRVDPRGLSTRATVVKGISVRLLDLIADAQDLKVLCGDIGNAFIQATTQEKIYTRCGSEFGPHAGSIALIVRALYGLTTSAERFHTLLADFLRSIGFKPSRFDRDVWMRLRDEKDGYDYICTHVDDFKVVAKEPGMWIERIAGAFLIKEHGPRNYYLGNDYTFHDGEDMWTYGCQTYAKEAVAKVERIFGCLPKETTPLPVKDCHPEMDTSPLLGLDDHRKFQMLLGMLQWLVTIGCPDLCTLVSSLNRFGTCPREGHLELAICAFGYIKQTPNKQIAIDWRPMRYSRDDPSFETLIPDFLKDYPDATEEMDANFPLVFGPIMETAILVDSDHAHDKKTRKSLTGLLAFVGSTPVLWMSKRQGSIASSTYAAEFSALRTATEEAQSLRYMLRCLGCNVPCDGSCPTKIFGDNFSVIQNSQNPAADLSKKHVAISYHVVREAIAARTIEAYWLKGKWNLSDIMTKQIPRTEFQQHCDYIFWRPQFHLRHDNRLDASYEDPA